MSRTAGQRREAAADKLIAACTDPTLPGTAADRAIRTIIDRTPGHPAVAVIPVATYQVVKAILVEAPKSRADELHRNTEAFIEEELGRHALTDLLAQHPKVQAAITEALAERVTAWWTGALEWEEQPAAPWKHARDLVVGDVIIAEWTDDGEGRNYHLNVDAVPEEGVGGRIEIQVTAQAVNPDAFPGLMVFSPDAVVELSPVETPEQSEAVVAANLDRMGLSHSAAEHAAAAAEFGDTDGG